MEKAEGSRPLTKAKHVFTIKCQLRAQGPRTQDSSWKSSVLTCYFLVSSLFLLLLLILLLFFLFFLLLPLLLSKYKLSLLYYFYFIWFFVFGVLPACVSVYHLNVWFSETRRGHSVSWNWSYRWFWVIEPSPLQVTSKQVVSVPKY